MPWRRQTSPFIDRRRQVLSGIARDCQILPGIMTVQILENEHRCRMYLKNVVCFEMTSNERCVHFSKFRNKTFKTNMDVVFIWKTWCVFKWHQTKVVCTFSNFASFSQNEHGCRIYLKNVGMFSNDIGRKFLPTFSKRTQSKTRCLFRRLVWKGRSCSAGLPHVLVCELCQKLIHRKFQDRRPRIRASVQNSK